MICYALAGVHSPLYLHYPLPSFTQFPPKMLRWISVTGFWCFVLFACSSRTQVWSISWAGLFMLLSRIIPVDALEFPDHAKCLTAVMDFMEEIRQSKRHGNTISKKYLSKSWHTSSFTINNSRPMLFSRFVKFDLHLVDVIQKYPFSLFFTLKLHFMWQTNTKQWITVKSQITKKQKPKKFGVHL